MKLHVHYCMIRNPDLSCIHLPESLNTQSTFSSFTLLVYLDCLKFPTCNKYTLPCKNSWQNSLSSLAYSPKHLQLSPNSPHHTSSNWVTASSAVLTPSLWRGWGSPGHPMPQRAGGPVTSCTHGPCTHNCSCTPGSCQCCHVLGFCQELPWDPTFCSKSDILNCSLNPHTKLVTVICIKYY